MFPQIIMILMLLVALCLSANKHGLPKGTENFWSLLLGVIFEVTLLWWGGFWDCFIK